MRCYGKYHKKLSLHLRYTLEDVTDMMAAGNASYSNAAKQNPFRPTTVMIGGPSSNRYQF